MKFHLVVAVDSELGIGKNNTLPWKLKGDLQYFRQLTSQPDVAGKTNAVIMGRKTWESLPEKSKPLKDRLNIVVSRNQDYPVPENVLLALSLEQALALTERPSIDKIFVIGGAELYKEALKHKDLNYIYLTSIHQTFACDTFFPDIREGFSCIESSADQSDNGVGYCFQILQSNRMPN